MVDKSSIEVGILNSGYEIYGNSLSSIDLLRAIIIKQIMIGITISNKVPTQFRQ